MAFGWSAGDILAAINFILRVTAALDEVSGSAQKFREASSFLRDLTSALRPLETFTTWDTKPSYQIEIRKQVEAIRIPIEKFINDDAVKKLQENLGAAKEGRWGSLRDVKSKLVWHFKTSEKALELRTVVENHLVIIGTLMQQLTVDMLQTLQTNFKGDVGKSLEETLNIQLPALRKTLADELLARDRLKESSWESSWEAKLESLLKNLLESYLGPRTAILSPSATLVNTAVVPQTPEMVRDAARKLECRYQSKLLDEDPYNTAEVHSDPEVIYALQDWWGSNTSELLWIQEPMRNSGEQGLAHNFTTIALAAKVPVAAYFCQRLDKEGSIFDQSEQFIELLYSLIYQFCKHRSCDFSVGVDLCPDRFAALDGTIKSVPAALTLLEDLLLPMPGRIIIVIDGVEFLDYSSDDLLESYLVTLFAILRNGNKKGSTKMLTVTQEHTLLVMENVGNGKVVDASLSDSSEGFFSLEDLQTA